MCTFCTDNVESLETKHPSFAHLFKGTILIAIHLYCDIYKKVRILRLKMESMVPVLLLFLACHEQYFDPETVRFHPY